MVRSSAECGIGVPADSMSGFLCNLSERLAGWQCQRAMTAPLWSLPPARPRAGGSSPRRIALRGTTYRRGEFRDGRGALSRQSSPQWRRAKMTAGIELFWLPLGAGGNSVRWNGRIFEWVVARIERRDSCELFHSALEVRAPEGRFVIEQAPAWRESAERGVVAEGAVGSRAAGRLRLFRYEIRCWRDGIIPDIAEAVDSPQPLSDDPAVAKHLLELVPRVPVATWARDELHAGEMWNSNSVISWLIVRGGLDVDTVHLPTRGRAPGWRAGIVVARRQLAKAADSPDGNDAPPPERKRIAHMSARGAR
jgi:hypothetical protein